jgi:OFA family oxalate/formate antiporter-like MFS transporter
MMSANLNSPVSTSGLKNPWVQLIVGVVGMACVANLQYGWTLFVDPIDAKYHWGRTAIQVAFTVFIAIETWLIPVEGYLIDRFGPRWVVVGGSILVAAAWALNSVAASLPVLYLGAALGGIGTGCVYGPSVGNALKWFPGRRGLAAGVTAAGFGIGAAFTVGPIKTMIGASGYEHAFLVFGLIQGAIVLMMSFLIAKDLKIEKIPVDLFGMVMPALVFAIFLNRIFDGVGRPFFGWLSDQIGREYTMALAFFTGAAALFTLSQSGANPVVFVLVSALYFGVYGEIFSLFPATQGDTFGAKFAASNAGMLYTAKGTAVFLVPVAAFVAKSHGWGPVFSIAMTFNIIAGLMALFVLKPMRVRHFARSREAFPAPASTDVTRTSTT